MPLFVSLCVFYVHCSLCVHPTAFRRSNYLVSGELEDMMIEVERSQSMANQAEKRQRNFDKTIDEWKRRVADLQVTSRHVKARPACM